MHFLCVSGWHWVAIVITAVVLSLSSGTADFLRKLPIALVSVAATFVLLTALGRWLLRFVPEGRFKRFFVEWL
ncbi:hypothetical protein FNU79_12620 [Deinococcus detaillensis]|uniref:Uncharacterized protein n=1 Tax=Deinococcus detaillensis TaxID=2592048 RepID=A0A553USJ8_9DEIO|nr:hypothetical protein [Deinococcus detaillensis]TSA83163.1 hypothetical protein FNU79_12620 [Deinococcus detaillensis]